MAKRRRGGRRPKGGALDLMGYALAGARARLQELARETGELFRHFPQLRAESPSPWGMTPARPRRRGSKSQVRAVGPPTGRAERPSARRRRRRKLSAEARAKISAAQKKRWAAQRKKAR